LIANKPRHKAPQKATYAASVALCVTDKAGVQTRPQLKPYCAYVDLVSCFNDLHVITDPRGMEG